jgi:hypothetical protein
VQWNRNTVITFALGAAAIVGGGCLAKWVSVEAGAALIAAGGWVLGWLRQQPAFAAPKE